MPARYPELTTGETGPLLHLGAGQQARADFQFHTETLHHVTGSVVGDSRSGSMVEVVDASGSKAYVLGALAVGLQFEAWVPTGRYQLESVFSSADGEFRGSMPLEVGDADVTGVTFPVTRSTDIQIPIEIEAIPPATSVMGGFWLLDAVRMLPNGYFEAGADSTQSGGMIRGAPIRRESIRLRPGSYMVQIAPAFSYAKSISSGEIDLIHNPLVVSADGQPDPIHIVLAQDARVEGLVSHEGKPVQAYVYAIPVEPDARLFQPVTSDGAGRFEVHGLAPESYIFFASDVELSLDLHDPLEIARWRALGKTVSLQAGKNAPLTLDLTPTENTVQGAR